MSPFVDTNNSGRGDDKEYEMVIDKISKDGVCPFCEENLSKYHKNPILADGKFWILTDNMYPYKGAKHHILLIHKKHTDSIVNLSKDAWDELFELTGSEIKKREIGGGTFFLRFGGTSYTGASVSHLHANLVSPDIEDKSRGPIIARIG